MWRYLKAAFLAPFPVPGLGRVPLNVVAVAGVAILGFGEPSVWLLGLGLEATFLSSLTFNKRFQKWVDAQNRSLAAGDTEQKRAALVGMLSPTLRDRLNILLAQCARASELYRSSEADAYVVESASDNLRTLGWLYLKLLVAKQNLGHPAEDDESSLTKKIGDLQAAIDKGTDSTTVRKSRLATMDILKKRMDVMHHKEQVIQEVDSDLMRIEAQVALAAENASTEGKPQAISTEIDLASDLGGGLFGDSESTIADLEAVYAHKSPAAPQGNS